MPRGVKGKAFGHEEADRVVNEIINILEEKELRLKKLAKYKVVCRRGCHVSIPQIDGMRYVTALFFEKDGKIVIVYVPYDIS